jgi:dTDP-4-dehydrorhamnose reductase
MNSILVLGVDGFLGNRLFHFVHEKYNVLGTSRRPSTVDGYKVIYFDANNVDAIAKILEKYQPSVVINCIAITDVDFCEKNVESCNVLNNLLPSHLAFYTNQMGIKLIHISTDHFQSELNEPRTEFTKVWAVNNYGKTKFDAENNIMAKDRDALIIRTNFFGFEANDKKVKLLSNIKERLESGLNFTGFTDVVFSPVSINTLIPLIYKLIEVDVKGIINISCSESVSKFQFAQSVAIALNISLKKVIPESIFSHNLLSKRPNYLALDNLNLRRTLDSEIATLDAMIADELKLYDN